MLHKISFILLVVGGLNWLVFAIFDWEIGTIFGGSDVIISKIIYILVGLAAVYLLVTHKKDCRHCMGKGNAPQAQA
ncbi:MAG: DUF378 domain-containing protein [Candidatus Niyogibacteria bacterium CG10_big_fil_rev_8_21_14_0_10_46_36]|uniref:DUF378 domain-containing protein n=1 Tax=Candidatus Niyogibacteria bacterium CG10_big_fil_rev_8_21_14_0_10_46_36 TaxID=1974726 RepID=A0A2H0TDW3_9BACT|nr:MAG: DUF378 domain-containing protein [Candidatus Niyogibacteria bacterium CG10_big_fil_rev_8_21_14_0_10_46_36]